MPLMDFNRARPPLAAWRDSAIVGQLLRRLVELEAEVKVESPSRASMSNLYSSQLHRARRKMRTMTPQNAHPNAAPWRETAIVNQLLERIVELEAELRILRESAVTTRFLPCSFA